MNDDRNALFVPTQLKSGPPVMLKERHGPSLKRNTKERMYGAVSTNIRYKTTFIYP